jgi:hypothetical protein
MKDLREATFVLEIISSANGGAQIKVGGEREDEDGETGTKIRRTLVVTLID